MKKQELNDFAWRCFYLGLRVAAAGRGEMTPDPDTEEHAALLHSIARGETTLHEPGSDAAECPELADFYIEAGNLAVRGDRILARRILAGLDAVCEHS